jgi:hypothetical protein
MSEHRSEAESAANISDMAQPCEHRSEAESAANMSDMAKP